MTSILIVLALTGTASQYSPGVMNAVIENRQQGRAWVSLPDPLPEAGVYAAVLECDRLGSLFLVKPEGGKWELALVTDCAGDQETTDWMTTNNILLEVDYKTAERWDTVGRGMKVEVIIMEKGQMFYDTFDGREMVVTRVYSWDHTDKRVIEFLQINPLGTFLQFEEGMLEEIGIVEKLPFEGRLVEAP